MSKYAVFPENPDWMSNLPEHLHETPLNQLAIPGCHDSGAYEFDRNEGLFPDAPNALKCLYCIFGRCTCIYRWAKTQNMNFLQQLTAGIRYFDLRVTTKPDTEDLYFYHTLYADKVEPCLRIMYRFLDEHPKEVIILDFNHFNKEMKNARHEQLIKMILEIFGDKVCPLQDTGSLTLNKLWSGKLQVIVIYHHATNNSKIWPGSVIRSPWFNTTDVNRLEEGLENVYKNSGDHEQIFLSYQGVLTPDTCFTVNNCCQSLKTALADKASPAVVTWLSTKVAGPNKMNICLIDFADQYEFMSTILAFNK
ncbi:PI-PLC X domain-containing protein 3-like [Patella vulgata]|uniref:PI-PLC X domain-containing protein 3-like n=1 Tax=Patella vulgata TaxID=6465 RepID=UPI0024A9C313|nr:PI-PLC X domain-containing protein 3-like [Patella vulgata]